MDVHNTKYIDDHNGNQNINLAFYCRFVIRIHRNRIDTIPEDVSPEMKSWNPERNKWYLVVKMRSIKSLSISPTHKPINCRQKQVIDAINPTISYNTEDKNDRQWWKSSPISRAYKPVGGLEWMDAPLSHSPVCVC